MPDINDPNESPVVADFANVQGRSPEPEAKPELAALQQFGGDVAKLDNAYRELQTKFSGDLGQLKHVVTGYDQKFGQLEKMLTDLGQKFQPQQPTQTPAASPAGQEADPWSRVRESYDKYDTEGFISSLKQAIPRSGGEEIKTLAQTVSQLSQSLSPENLVKLIQTTVEENQAKFSLEAEKKQLLTGGYSEDLVNLAGVTAYQNGKSSYLEGMEILRQKFPGMFEQKSSAGIDQLARIVNTSLPVEMSGKAPETNGLAGLHKQFQQVVEHKTPSSQLLNLATRR